jgi:hypothetical protein
MAGFIERIKKMDFTASVEKVGSGNTNAEKARLAADLGGRFSVNGGKELAGETASHELLHALADKGKEGSFFIYKNPFGYPVGAGYRPEGNRTEEEQMRIVLAVSDLECLSKSDLKKAVRLIRDNPDNEELVKIHYEALGRALQRRIKRKCYEEYGLQCSPKITFK